RPAAEHPRVGGASERGFAPELEHWLELLAYQFERAGSQDRDKAIDYLRAAAAQAQARLANDQAAAFYRRALELAAAAAEPDPRLRCSLLIDLGDAERRSGQHAPRNTLLQAGATPVQLQDGDSPARAPIRPRPGPFRQARRA